jgi:hypothetical protein
VSSELLSPEAHFVGKTSVTDPAAGGRVGYLGMPVRHPITSLHWQGKEKLCHGCGSYVVGEAGLEPTTPGLEGRCAHPNGPVL